MFLGDLNLAQDNGLLCEYKAHEFLPDIYYKTELIAWQCQLTARLVGFTRHLFVT